MPNTVGRSAVAPDHSPGQRFVVTLRLMWRAELGTENLKDAAETRALGL